MPAETTPLNYNHLYYFYRAGVLGSLSAAARELQLTQPTVSAQIKALEKHLGRELFERRTGGSMKLTSYGRQVFEHSSKMFKQSEVLLTQMSGSETEQRAAIRIGIEPNTSAPFVGTLFLPLVKDLRLSPHLHFGTHEELIKALTREELDLVVTDTAPSPAIASNLSSELFHAPRMLAVASQEVAERVQSFPGDFRDVGITQYSKRSSVRTAIDVYLTEHNLAPRVWVESDDVQVQIAAASEGLGVTFIPENLRESVADKGLVELGFIDEVRMTVHGVFLERTASEHVRSAVQALIQPTTARQTLV